MIEEPQKNKVLLRSFTISFRIYDGQSQHKNRLILTQLHIYCFQLFRSWLQIHMLIVMAFVFFTFFNNRINLISIIISLFKHKLHINDSIPYIRLNVTSGKYVVRTLCSRNFPTLYHDVYTTFQNYVYTT